MTKPPLHHYQETAIDFLHGTPRALLCLDLGLGKSRIALEALTPEHLPALIIAPKRVAELTWPVECKKWRPDLEVAFALGSPEKREREIRSGADITIITQDTLKDLEIRPPRFKTVIFDESSKLKSRSSGRWKHVRKLTRRPFVKSVWLMTGTPVPNGLMDIWSQVFIIDGGERLGKNITTYRSRYFYPGRQLPTTGVVVRWDLKENAEERIHEKLDDIAIGMKSEYYLDLPEVTYNNVELQLPDSVMKLYREFKRNLVVDLEILGGEVHTAANAAVVTSKLCQIAAGAIYVDDADLRNREYKVLHEYRLDVLEEIYEGTGAPLLVFYEFKFEPELIRKRFPFARHINDKNILEDWNAGKVPMLLAHPASASHGLNLQEGGSNVAWFEPTFNLEYYEQGNGRVARQGQNRPVIVHHIVAKGTVDEVKMEVLSGKATVQDALTRHLESPV